ncbi:MAG: endo-1,4-beta-xylanase [Bacteroidetes bacterium]|jgi:endo-1,4-beta-xylanase|nr:endo-1,4-beta-xylanase [Bacteroidota bacterium]MDF1863968.1 endo-1,4-beta-xylanase [Saprospiraceae bacterium]
MQSTYIFLLFLFLISICANCNIARESTPIAQGLKDYADFPIGNSISIRKIIEDEKYRTMIKQNFNSITSGNDMKMYTIGREEGKYNWEKADETLAFCERNNQRIFGHTLVWHLGLPKWIQNNGKEHGADWVDEYLETYITKVVSRYKGKVAAWDVVNEAFETAGGNYRETFWYQYLGKEYIAKAFRYAHAADPEAELFYNDFNIERDTAKFLGVLKMIEELKSEGVPITGLGFQMHLRMDIPDEVIAYTLKKAGETGLKIHFSELDIIFNRHDDTKDGGEQVYKELTKEMEQAQAEKYKNLVLMYRKYIPKNQQYGITFWGCNDRDTWIKRFFGIEDWPTVFDENLNPKRAYYGFMEGLKEKIR